MGLWAVEVRGRDLAGRTIRTGPGAWRESSSTATECPDFGVYLTGKPPADPGWEFRWVNWPDFRVPSSTSKAVAALRETHQRAASERVEICLRRWHGSDRNCFGITCRSKWTAGREDVSWVREHYRCRAVETPWQRRWIINTAVAVRSNIH